MISTVDLFKEIKIMEEVVKAEKDMYKKASLKAQILNLKLLHNLRTNTVLVMDHLGIKKAEKKVDTRTEQAKRE